ncbi:MAG: insulinase family protein [Acidobacteria bacterium]|nr:insulinase family protein [Acidobacteriota bacterium]
MKLLISTLLFLTLLAVSGPSFAQTGSSDTTEFEVNGLKVIFKRRTTAATVAVGLFTRGGVTDETAKNAGIEGLMWNTAAEASRSFPREVLQRELARTGTSIDGSAGYDYGTLAMISTSENFVPSWDLFADVARNPSFNDADLARIKAATIAGLRDRGASPDGALSELEAKGLFVGHPYSVRPSGTIESINAITAADLKAFHNSLMQTSHLLLVVVGDVDEAQVRKLVETAFGSLPRGDYRKPAVPPLSFAKPSLDIERRAISTNYIRGSFAAPSLADPDYYAMRVAVTILQSRVYQAVRVERNLSYAPNADMYTLAANSANIYVTAVDANQAVSVMLDEIQRLKTENVNEDDFGGISSYFLTSYYIDHETNASIAGELAQYELIGGGWRRSEVFLRKIRAVTPQEVKAAALKYMKNLRFVVVGDPAAIDRTVFLQN